MRDEEAPGMASSGKPSPSLACQPRAGNYVTRPCESRKCRPLRITGRTWPRAGMEQEEPPSHFRGLSKGSGQSFWQGGPHGRDCRGQFLGTWSRTEKDGERMWDGDGKMKREDSPTQIRVRSCYNGFRKKHGEAEPGQLQRKQKCWGQMCGNFRGKMADLARTKNSLRTC